MNRPADQTLWHALRCAWLAAATDRPADPRLAEDALPDRLAARSQAP